MKIILGSESPQRKKILASMGYEFEVVPSHINEKEFRNSDPRALSLGLANAKADALLPKLLDDILLITADQVVFFEGKIFEKPSSMQEAREMLQGYGNLPVHTITAVVVVNKPKKLRVEGIDSATIYFKPFTREFIDIYTKNKNALAHAGAFATEDPLFAPFIEKIEGEGESVLGLPKELTRQLMREALSK